MKKSFYGRCALPIIIFLFASCASQPIVFNEALGTDEIAIIHWHAPGISVVGYNGITVNWGGAIYRSSVFKIPGGSTQFLLNGMTGTMNMGYTTYSNVPFNYYFENGNEYTVVINQHLLYIFNGKSRARKNFITSFNMGRGQAEIERK